MICLYLPQDAQASLQKKFVSFASLDTDTCNVIFLVTIRDLYNMSVWSLCDYVCSVDRSRRMDREWQPDFVYLHDIAKHIIHSNETLESATNTIEVIRSACGTDSRESSETWKMDHQGRLQALEYDIKCTKRRSEGLTERLQNEINLVRIQVRAQ